MIGWRDIYKVVVAMAPLYTTLGLGYASVRWWRVFSPEQCAAINRLVSFFTLPFFTLEFALGVDPFSMNRRFIAADVVSKVVILLFVLLCSKFSSSKASCCWSITSFSLATLTNSLVVGVPMLTAMYGPSAQSLVVQSSVFQAIVWLTILLLVLELHKAGDRLPSQPATAAAHVVTVDHPPPPPPDKDDSVAPPVVVAPAPGKPSFWSLMKTVWMQLAINPNSYASILGMAWAFVANRWHFEMPEIIGGSISIMSRAGTGMAMFSMGLFMALQEKLVACGPRLTAYGMALRFVASPAAMAIGAIAVGLHGDVLRVAIIQAALPQSITSFIYARDYGLHADILSTAVIFGMLVSLPVLIAYYALLGFIN